MSATMGNTAVRGGKMGNNDYPWTPDTPGADSPTFGNRESFGAKGLDMF